MAQPRSSPRPVQLCPLFSVMHTNVNTIVWPIHHSKKSQRKVFSLSCVFFPSFLRCLLWLCVLCVCYVQIRRLKPNIPMRYVSLKHSAWPFSTHFLLMTMPNDFHDFHLSARFLFDFAPHTTATTTLSKNLFLCLWAHFFTPFSHMYTFFSHLFPALRFVFFSFSFHHFYSWCCVYSSCHAARPLLYVRHFPYCYCYRFVVPSFLLRVRTFLALLLQVFPFYYSIVYCQQPMY